MRTLAALLLLASVVPAGDFGDNLYLVRVTTERGGFRSAVRQVVLLPAIPVGQKGLFMSVGVSLQPPRDPTRSPMTIQVRYPDGNEYDARLLGGDDDLECTFFRVTDKKAPLPEPVKLENKGELKPGAELTVWGRRGGTLKYALRTARVRYATTVRNPRAMHVTRESLREWIACPVTDAGGNLVGFVATVDTGRDREQVFGLPNLTPVIFSGADYARAAQSPPEPGRVATKAWIGINLAPFDEDRRAYFLVQKEMPGVIVTSVAPNSPAAAAGFKVGDLVQRLGSLNMHLPDDEHFRELLVKVQALPTGTPLVAKVVRFHVAEDGAVRQEPMDLEITLAPRPADFRELKDTKIEDVGFSVRPATVDWKRNRRIPDRVSGVVVTSLERGQPAQVDGLRINDLILRVDQTQTPDVAGLQRAVQASRTAKRGKLVFFVLRGTQTLFVGIRMDW